MGELIKLKPDKTRMVKTRDRVEVDDFVGWDRVERIRVSLDKINKLMAELKAKSKYEE